MTPPLIIGQAPARGSTLVDEQGVLVPFQGYSGARLRRLAGVENLSNSFLLRNIFDDPVDKRQRKGDDFPMEEARTRAQEMMRWIHRVRPPVVLLMGRKVERAFGFQHIEFLKPRRWKGIQFIVFPHPSGVSHWWNIHSNREAASRLLHDIVRAYG